MEFEFDEKGMEELLRRCDTMFETKLGPRMEQEVKNNAPVDTGSLRDSVKASVDRTEHKLYIEASGDMEREGDNRRYYAAWVDLGHEQVAWGNYTGEIKPPTAFMRRALYRRYGGF